MLRYKACRKSIVTLELLDNSVTNEKRDGIIDKIYAKFRCNKAKVISIINVKTQEKMEMDRSIYPSVFVYTLGEIRKTYFDENLDTVCTRGIHYFKTFEAALSWFYRQNNNFPDGKWIAWHENGQKKHEETYKDHLHDGKWITWRDNGNKESEGTYKDMNRDGKWIDWWDNGNKESEGTFKDGDRDGKWIDWYYSGHKNSEGTYKDGNIDGKWIDWWEDGNKESEGTFKDGKEIFVVKKDIA